MDSDYFFITSHLLAAVVAGGVIGLERSYHGRPAGFRTHTLVCLSSTLLMLVTVYQAKWMPALASIQTDPTRMAQGIMTGIGFLGAGVIYKENFTVRGLTTAASIWITSAIGILIGIGFHFPAIFATLLALGTLSLFRRFESWMPSNFYSHYTIGFDRTAIMSEQELRELLKQHGFTVANISYSVTSDTQLFLYQAVIRTTTQKDTALLADTLRKHELVREFRISPAGD